MSFTVTTDIFCDKCQGDWVGGATSNRVRVNVARAIARSQGWTCPKKTSEFQKDLCPICNGKATGKGEYGYHWKEGMRPK